MFLNTDLGREKSVCQLGNPPQSVGLVSVAGMFAKFLLYNAISNFFIILIVPIRENETSECLIASRI